MSCDITKITLEASRQGRKGEPTSAKKTVKLSKKPQLKNFEMLSGMMLSNEKKSHEKLSNINCILRFLNFCAIRRKTYEFRFPEPPKIRVVSQ